ncbi:ImmA/IrrE family metallo-endopeptidase [Botrimarina mediterranea]|uniref:Uncharacterized protein n=1 Tax=Botrimarina mediterranea TaxID=2528022 RepID=A0A518K6H2_9BACT|nr:ImmA/IrrE family metallo-endopeptidase [Botrimarina mediterranea]QDV73392.1 hypothetical protein Spa11_15880 [Botrimarina mediterranea]QDV77909.1 hypothetical protein K2D_15140 [Planctomycetes bacterium K2D]
MLTEIPTEELHATLDRCALDLLWEASVDRPPVDAFVIAENLGLVVAQDQGLVGRGRFARLAGGRPLEAILIAGEDRSERRHFVVAHEIGESQAHRVFEALGVDPREAAPSMRESIANTLAGRLLAPRRWLVNLWRDLDGDLLEIKHVLATASHELIARRLLECVRAPLVVTVTDHGRVTWRRWNFSGSPPPRLRLEVDCQQYAHETGQPAWGDGSDEPHSAGGAPIERVRCWPIHESDWRREITFTELVDADAEWV